jgi:exosome complex exonuclease RRP6
MPKKSKTYDALEPSMRRANILKPQNTFELKPDNVGTTPWKPLLTKKPHALLPFEKSVGVFNNEDHSVEYDYTIFLPYTFQHPLVEGSAISSLEQAHKRLKRNQNSKKRKWKEMTSIWSADSRFRYKHPYETEILSLEYPQTVYQIIEPIKYQPVETTVATFVNTFEGVLEMLSELKKAKEIAIDTEHHDFRTYSGLLSLMQISTRDKDWIVDTLQPWRHKLEVLNEVFADPSIVKVSNCSPGLSAGRILRFFLGLARRIHGYHLAPERLRFIHRWTV